jgi:hypothetical protein
LLLALLTLYLESQSFLLGGTLLLLSLTTRLFLATTFGFSMVRSSFGLDHTSADKPECRFAFVGSNSRRSLEL